MSAGKTDTTPESRPLTEPFRAGPLASRLLVYRSGENTTFIVSDNQDGERGSALVWTLLVVFSLLGLTAASLLGSSSDTKISSNYQSGIQALLAAESGIFHAQEAINERGVISFNDDIFANWGSIFGSSTRAIQAGSWMRVVDMDGSSNGCSLQFESLANV